MKNRFIDSLFNAQENLQQRHQRFAQPNDAADHLCRVDAGGAATGGRVDKARRRRDLQEEF
jgi:hypothetical protein